MTMKLFKGYYKKRGTVPAYPPEHAIIRAYDRTDAKRVLQENLDTRKYIVVAIEPATLSMITPETRTVGFCSPYLKGGLFA